MRERITRDDFPAIIDACRHGQGEKIWLTPFGWVVEIEDGKWLQVDYKHPLRDDGQPSGIVPAPVGA